MRREHKSSTHSAIPWCFPLPVFVVLSASSFPWAAVWGDAKETAESVEVRVEQLEITDPAKVHVREIPTDDKLRWLFRVYVPASEHMLLQASEGRGGSGVGWPKTSEVVRVAAEIVQGPLRHKPDVKWHLLIEFGERRNTVPLSREQVERIRERQDTSGVAETTVVADPGKRVRIKTLLPPIPGHFAEEFSGVEIWLEPSKG